MSQETLTWLNENTLIGFTDKRGTAWHYRESEQGAEPNHYPLAVPVADVQRRLFNWTPVECDLTATGINSDGVVHVPVPDRKAIVHPTTGEVFGIFTKGYKVHGYNEWLISHVQTILDDDLSIGSAGLLRKGAVAWVSVEVPNTITTPSGVAYRPNLLAATSLDGTLPSIYKPVITNVVCDNTMAAGLGEKGAELRIKHTRFSRMKVAEARAALDLVHTVGDSFAEEVEQLTNTTVSDGDWAKFLDTLVPLPEDEGRGLTMAENKRADMSALWNGDPRVAPWKNTAWGVVQAVNTYQHHNAIVRNAERAERNMLNAVTGEWDKLDAQTKATLQTVMS